MYFVIKTKRHFHQQTNLIPKEAKKYSCHTCSSRFLELISFKLSENENLFWKLGIHDLIFSILQTCVIAFVVLSSDFKNKEQDEMIKELQEDRSLGEPKEGQC